MDAEVDCGIGIGMRMGNWVYSRPARTKTCCALSTDGLGGLKKEKVAQKTNSERNEVCKISEVDVSCWVWQVSICGGCALDVKVGRARLTKKIGLAALLR